MRSNCRNHTMLISVLQIACQCPAEPICQMRLTIAFDSSEMNTEYGYYDPGTNMIALDPDRPGALAHDLFHAVDFHLAAAFGIGPNITKAAELPTKKIFYSIPEDANPIEKRRKAIGIMI